MNLSKILSEGVIVWGIGEDAVIPLKILNSAGIEIKFIVDPTNSLKEFEGLKVLGIEEFYSLREKHRAIPILIADAYDSYGPDGFIRSLNMLYNRINHEGPAIHPVFISELVRLNFSGYVYINGFPGSGNVVSHHIIKKLMELNGGCRLDERERFFKRASEFHNRSIINVFNSYFNIYATANYPKGSDFRGDFLFLEHEGPCGDYVHLFGARSKPYFSPEFHASHELLRETTITRFENLGFSTCVVIRNPLDVIVSNAAKFPINSKREKRPSLLINDLEWFESMIVNIGKCYKNFIDNKDKVFFVKYDDLMENPIRTIKNLAVSLDIEVTEAQCRDIWSEFGNRNLNDKHFHCWRPGSGKWKEFIGAKQIEMFRASKLADYSEQLGYRYDFDANMPRTSEKPVSEDLYNDIFALYDFRYHTILGKPLVYTSDGCTYLNDEKRGMQAIVRGNMFPDMLKMALSSKVFNATIFGPQCND